MSVPVSELKNLRLALAELHRQLLESLKVDREAHIKQIINPIEWLQLLVNATEYRWVKPFNSLLADLDALMDHPTFSPEDLAVIRGGLDELFFRENPDADSFYKRYFKMVPEEHAMMFAHGQLRQIFNGLPKSTPPSDSTERRKNWHVKAKKG